MSVFSMVAFIAVPALLLLFVGIFIAKQYRRCASNEVLVIYGKVSGNQTAKCIHGGGAFVVPLIQDYTYLSLEPIQITVDLEKALSAKNIRVNVPSTFTVGISSKQEILSNAAERLLGLKEAEISAQARDIIFGQLRQVIATMTIEEINADRDKFISSVSASVGTELKKIGLEVINVNIRDITDESGYIDAIGRKAAAEAVQQANIDVSQKERDGRIGVETAKREETVKVAEQQAQGQIGEKDAEREQRVKTQAFESQAVQGENTAKAEIAQANADLAVKEAEALKQGEVAKAEAQRAVLDAQKEQQVALLRRDELANEEVQKQKVVVQAEARAEQERTVAKGEADAILAKYKAEAEGVQAVLEAKAEGYRKLVEAAGGESGQAASLLMIEKIEEVSKINAEAIKNLKFGEITVWDGGRQNGEVGATAGFVRDFAKMIPPLQDLAAQTGVKLPEFLGTLANGAEKKATTGVVGN